MALLSLAIAASVFTAVFVFCVAIAFPEAIAAVWNAVVPPLVDFILGKVLAIAELFSYGTVITRTLQITKSSRRRVESKEFVIPFGEAFAKFAEGTTDAKDRYVIMYTMLAWAAVGGNLKKPPDAMDSVDLTKFIISHWAELQELSEKYLENMHSLEEQGLLPDLVY
jgi:hypothetical protein